MNPFEILGLSPSSSPSEVTARWRELASTHHPDRGGDPAEFDRYRQAFNEARKLAHQPRPCEACQGKGSTQVVRGFHSLKVVCSSCGGKGQINQEHP